MTASAREQAVQEIERAVDGLNDAFMQRDLERVLKFFAHDKDVFVFGTDPDETLVGFDAIADAERRMLSALEQCKLTVRDRRAWVAPSGTTGWFEMVLDIDAVADGRSVQVRDLRQTGVLEKRAGGWVATMLHASVPAPGQVLPYPSSFERARH